MIMYKYWLNLPMNQEKFDVFDKIYSVSSNNANN